MKSRYLRFLKKLLVFSLILGFLTGTVTYFLPKSYLTPALPFLFFFFIAVTLISYHFLLQSIEKKLIKFTNTYLLTTFIKLLLYIVVMIGYVFFNRSDAIPFMLWFFFLYLCYTIFEVVMVVGRPEKPSTNTNNSIQ